MGRFTSIFPSSLAARFSSLLPPRQHASPIPNTHNGRRQRTLPFLHIVFLALLISISIPVIVLRAISYSFVHSNLDMAFVYRTTDKLTNTPIAVVMAAIPKAIYQKPAYIALATAILVLLLSATHLALILSPTKRRTTDSNPAIFPFLYTFLTILLLLSLILLSTTHASSSHFRVSYVDSAASFLSNDTNWSAHDYVRYDLGTFDLETWACELRDVTGAVDAKDDYGRQCVLERAARAIVVPFLLALGGMAVLGMWTWMETRKRGGRVGKGDEEKRGAVEEIELVESDEQKPEMKHEEKVEIKKDEKIDDGSDTAKKDEQAETSGDGTVKLENKVTKRTEKVENNV